MEYSFHPEAQTELALAIDYYEEREKGLGQDFAVEVYAAVERAAAYPRMWPLIVNDVRRCLIRRFPYGVLYAVDEAKEEMLIVAVMHLHREPNYWAGRN